MVTLVGEPGIGKTRTAQELATYAGLRRCQVLWGRCYEGGGAPSYWPWVQAIRSYVREREQEQLVREMGSTASVIAEVVPDVKERVPGVQPPPHLDSPESARFRLFDSIATFLKTASRNQPLLIIIDDLHWSDKPSLLLLEFVAREIGSSRIPLTGTYRDVELNRRHPLAVTLGDLTKERLFEWVLLRGLQQHDVERFIEMAAGVKPPAGFVDAVHTQTEGNPLFVTEVVRWLAQEGQLTREKVAGKKSWSMPIPEGVRDVIGKRLDRLSPRCNDVLITASVVGRRFALQALARLYSDELLPVEERLTENRLLEVLEEALAARVVEELPTGPGRYQFTHALIQETLAQELSTTRKVRLHARIALVLEDLYRDRLGERAAELASHFAEAETVLGTEKLVRYSMIAGEAALAATGHEEALAHFERALAALGSSTTNSASAVLHWGAGKALAALRRVPEALQHLRSAFDQYLQSGELDDALRVAAHPFVSAEGGVGMAPTREKALEVAPEDSVLTGYLLATHARALGNHLGDYPGAKAAIGRALQIASKHGDKHLEFRARSEAAFVASWNLERQEFLDNAQEAVKLASQVDDPLETSLLYQTLTSFYGRTGDDANFKRYLEPYAEFTKRAGDRQRLSTLHLVMAGYAAHRGEWDAARKYCELSLGYWAHDLRTMSVGLEVACLSGTESEISGWIERMRSVEAPEHDGARRTALLEAALITGSAGITAQALEAAQHPRRDLHVDRLVALFELQAKGLVAILSNDRDAASALYGELRPFEALSVPQLGSVEETLGRLAAMTGVLDAAAAHLANAAERARLAGFRPVLAWVDQVWADVLLERGAPGDRERATELCDESLAIAQELGKRRLIERVIARKKVLGA